MKNYQVHSVKSSLGNFFQHHHSLAHLFPNTAAAAAAAKSLQSCPTLCDPIDGSPPGPAVLGFSRQEHWSGLPWPSPMHESEKWKWSHSVVSNSEWPHGLQPTRLLHPWDFPGRSTGVGCHCLLCSKHWDLSKNLVPSSDWGDCRICLSSMTCKLKLDTTEYLQFQFFKETFKFRFQVSWKSYIIRWGSPPSCL